MVTVSDIVMNADLFKRAYPHWPHPEPEKTTGVPALEIHGGAGTLIDVRSPAHMRYDRDPRIAPTPALVGWVNRDEGYHGTPVYNAMYAGPYREAAVRFATFSDPAQAVQWIAETFSEEGN